MCSDFYIDEVSEREGGTGARFFKAYHFNGIAGTPKYGGSERIIREDIYKFGPVATAIAIYPDFYTFDNKHSIYEWNGQGPQVGGHAIVIVGWGSEKGVLYWQIRNSWGTEWGDQGYFKMIRGNNNCGIEENVMGAIPDFFYPKNYKWTGKVTWGETDQMIQERMKIAYDLSMPGGGINPQTGYTRRVMLNQPWLDISKPRLDELPNYKTFVAGRDVRFIQPRTPSSTSSLGSGSTVVKGGISKQGILILGLSIVFFFFFFLLLLFCIFRIKKNKKR
jgi:cathepsin B